MMADYIKERFPSIASLPNLACDTLYNDYLRREGFSTYATAKGFFTYKMEGDAIIINDMYIKPEHRRARTAHTMANKLFNLARKCGKRVAIGFSEPSVNPELAKAGQAAMEFAGFKHYMNADNQMVYIKGI